MLTLWDLITRKNKSPKRKRGVAATPEDGKAPEKPKPLAKLNHPHADVGMPPTAPRAQSEPRPSGSGKRRESMADQYERMTRECLATYGVRVRKWRSSMSGCAWEVYYHDGRTSRLIEAPKPKGPMSAAIFLHEIGHHAIGFGRYKPRCLEEYHAWAWAITEMERRGLNVTDAVRKRMRESLIYAVDKAKRRGLKVVPVELAVFLQTESRPR